ncbi:hypothetical protein B0H11DRAFT_2280000 [Mycena galericulata]|nr:hypothetical protein B0H11DRAFT_2294601 [Mycena galericulata]KAJ7482995.1 hypothetical protein B0H11DRAFT_2280000 [Mycena galericulata]
MLIQPFVVSALALAASMCRPLCHQADKENYALIAQSGGEQGVPLYCGYARGANCFYGVKGGDLNYGPEECPDKSLGQCP